MSSVIVTKEQAKKHAGVKAGTHKRCGKFRTILPLSAFGKRKASSDGLQYICKEAMKAREIKWERLEAEATEVAASATDE